MNNIFKAFLIKYGEIGIKGKNRYLFEDALVNQIKYSLKKVAGNFTVSKESGRIYVEALDDVDYEDTIAALKKVFGITAICPMIQVEDKGFDDLAQKIVEYFDKVYPDKNLTFKVEARRGRKNYPLNSMEINAEVGHVLLEAYDELKVDVHHPDVLLNVEIRQNINIYSLEIPGPCGMPVGTNGKGMLLLSGGIDSPVAGYMVAKRGVCIDACYFSSPPYTSERATKKVKDLAKIVSSYAGPINLHIVNFTDIQLHIYEKCPHDELTIIMKRVMVRIAEKLCEKTGALGIITGESIGQVSSQTMQSLATINEVATMPIFRPVVAFDKQEIIDLAIKIGTYETSIEPYEDCCTIFVAKHPVTKPNINMIKKSESKLADRIEELIETAVNTVEVVRIE